MPIEDITGHALSGLLRLLGYLVTDVFVEFIIKGPGYLLCRLFKREVDLDSGWVVFVGVIFWACIGGLAYGIHKFAV